MRAGAAVALRHQAVPDDAHPGVAGRREGRLEAHPAVREDRLTDVERIRRTVEVAEAPRP